MNKKVIDYRQPLASDAGKPDKEIPDEWPRAAHEKAMIFSLARAFWIICESVPSNKTPEKTENDYSYSTTFSDASSDLPQEWKEIILKCVAQDPTKGLRWIKSLCSLNRRTNLLLIVSRGGMQRQKKHLRPRCWNDILQPKTTSISLIFEVHGRSDLLLDRGVGERQW